MFIPIPFFHSNYSYSNNLSKIEHIQKQILEEKRKQTAIKEEELKLKKREMFLKEIQGMSDSRLLDLLKENPEYDTIAEQHEIRGGSGNVVLFAHQVKNELYPLIKDEILKRKLEEDVI